MGMDAEPKTTLNPWTTTIVGVVGALLLWASLPPLGLSWLGWIAPVPWLWLARLPQLPGRRPYAALYFSGALFWILTNHWLRLPHPATSLGWFALSFYLAVYTPLIVGLARVAARWKIGIVVSGPVLWVAADQARAYVFSGFSMSSLCHSQWRNTHVIQFADVCGEFGVTLLMVMIAASIARALPVPGTQYSVLSTKSLSWLVVAPIVLAAMFFHPAPTQESTESLKVALIQGSIESEVKHDPTKPPLIYQHYLELSSEALKNAPQTQLIVWPETMFPYPYWIVDADAAPAAGEEWTPAQLRERADSFRQLIAQTAQQLGKPMLLGVATAEFGAGTVKGFNTALLVDAQGKPLGRYDKQHRVMFGEYIPLADWFPWLYQMTPLTGGIEAGARAESMTVDGVRLAPNICYETALARVVRRQVKELHARNELPDVLVNLTNDSWFRGSSELDLHLACGVFRAVEMRRPLVIAANTGFSAYIDSSGRIVRQSPRGDSDALIADVRIDRLPPSPYLLYGDWLAWLCLAAGVVLGAFGLYERRVRRK